MEKKSKFFPKTLEHKDRYSKKKIIIIINKYRINPGHSILLSEKEKKIIKFQKLSEKISTFKTHVFSFKRKRSSTMINPQQSTSSQNFGTPRRERRF